MFSAWLALDLGNDAIEAGNKSSALLHHERTSLRWPRADREQPRSLGDR